MGFQMARREIDDEALDFAASHRFQLGRHDLDMGRKIELMPGT